MSVTIRPAGPSDVPLLADLGARTFRDAYAGQVPADALEAFVGENFTPERIEAEQAMPGWRFLVAETAGESVAYALLILDSPHPTAGGRHPAELQRIYAEQAWIGQGVGSALMRAVLDDARAAGADLLWLGVWSENARAIGFYRRWGFVEVGRAPFDLGGVMQEDVLMRLTLAAGGETARLE